MNYEFDENKKQVDFLDGDNQVSVKFYNNGDITIRSFPNIVCLTQQQLQTIMAIYERENKEVE